MASFFISHSSRDNDIAGRLRLWLEEEGFTSLFLDFDPEIGIPPGRRWEDEIYSELRKADILIFVASRAALDSKWCHAELVMARSLGRTILPVLLEPEATHPLVRDTQWIRLAGNGLAEFQPVAEAIRRLGVDALDTLPWDPRLAPYPGLAPFDEKRAGVFYGRDDEIEAVVARLMLRHTEGHERLVLVAGASGSGKSSLIRAGVIPRLGRLEEPWVSIPSFKPGDQPLKRLSQALCESLRASGQDVDWRECRTRLAQQPHALAEYVDDLLLSSGSADDGHVVLVIDQGEQLATQAARQERVAVLELLVDALDRSPQLRAIVTLRSEYLSEVVEGSPFEGRALPIVTVGRLGSERLAEVIERPAQRAGLVFEPGLVSRMIEEVAGGASQGGDPLPLLAFLLRRLYDERSDRTVIAWADYTRVGGVSGALRATADGVLDELASRGKRDLVVPTLLELAHAEPDHEPSSRAVPRSQFTDEAWEVIEAFVEARLLTTDGDEPVVYVTHDALLREWPLLERAIADFSDELVTRSRLTRDAREWQLAEHERSYLLGGKRLDEAVSALRSPRWSPEPLVEEYVAASERQARRDAWRRGTLIALALIVALALIGVSTWLVADRVRESWRKNSARSDLVSAGNASFDSHEVTDAQFDLCVREDRCRPPGATGDGSGLQPGLPPGARAVVMIDAQQAAAFCHWIDRRLPDRGELLSATRAGRLEHLLEGGREWTATPKGDAFWTIYLDPDTQLSTPRLTNRGFRDLDLTFRCAATR